jgi:hypothetical protein
MGALERSAIAALLLLGTLVACTAVVADDPVQCTVDSDCAARGPDFRDTICGPSGLCVAKPVPPPECTKNADCAAAGPDQVCSTLQHKCAPLTSEDCSVVYGDPHVDGTVLFGLLSEIGRDDTLYFRQQQHVSAAKLAFTEFFDKAGARLPGERGAALIACSEHSPRRASAHLANLGVKAVIGPSGENRQKAVVETLLPARVASFSPWINGNPSSVVPEAAGFAWLAGFKRSDVIAPLNALLAEQETRLEAGGALAGVRVAVVLDTPTTSEFNPFAEYGDLMDQRLVFNGKSAVENERDAACGNCYRRFATNQADKSVVEQRAAEIVAFNPHFIIPFTDIDWGAQLLPELEERYAAAPKSVPRPIYLQPFLQIEDAGYKALPVMSAAIRRRITGIRPLRDNSFELFQNKFREAFRPPSAPDSLGAEANPGAGRAFETALLLLFATYAALSDNPDALSEDVVAALSKVTDSAAPTRITLNDIRVGVQRLNAKDRINLDGLFTFFDFDLATNSAPPTWTTWCVDASGQYLSGGRIFKDGTFGEPAFCQ